MSRPKDKSPVDEPDLRLKVIVGANVIGPGKVALLALVAETGSISGAARKMGLSYRRAWHLLETLQACFAEPLFQTARGGPGTGGASLTATGEALIARHSAFQSAVDTLAAPYLDWISDNGHRRDAT